ncbi:MAG: penicillin-binding protein 2 [Patescibacteria group bacterium]
MVFFILILVTVVALKLYSVQILSYSSYKALAEDQHTIFKKLVPRRGEIFLKEKDGLYPLAVNKETKMAFAVPKEVEDAAGTAEKLSQILQLEKNALLEKLNKPDDEYEVLKHWLSDEEVQKINGARLKGVELSDENYRYYPSNELASQTVGFVGWKDNSLSGRYGLEAYFEKTLRGSEGNIFQSRDSRGRWIAIGQRDITEARDGDNLVLTIDHIVQYESEKLLKSAVEKYDAEGGSIVVMEPATGKILSMANYPTFDPNNYSQVENMAAYKNAAVSDAYESGSVFKTITIAAGLDSNKINPDTTYSDTGSVKEAGYTIKNSDLKAYGTQTISQLLEKSLNTGAIFVEKLVGNKNFSDYVKRFGFGEPTGIDLVGESGGNLENLKNLKSNIQFFTASFGQGIAITPIQLAAAYNAIANGGVLMKPQIVEKIIHADGSEESFAPQEVRRVVSERAAVQTGNLLRNVVTKGHGKRADVPGYLVAGKTGTAQVASASSRGYEEGKNIGSFAGFAPLNDPKFTILVKINNPKSVQWAESSAAPTFGELMKFLLEYYNIEPTEDYTQTDLDIFNQTHNLKDNFVRKEEEKLNIENPIETDNQPKKEKNKSR